MANELTVNYPTGNTLYALLLNSIGQIWNGAAFETPQDANWANYDIALTEAENTELYRGDMPGVAAGVYSFVVRKQAGGSPAVTDISVGVGVIHWDGSAEVSLYGVNVTKIEGSDATDQIGDAVLDEALSGHTTSGTAGHALGRISSGQITAVGPVKTSGDIEIDQGYDYYAADGYALEWTDSDGTWPDLTSATITFIVEGELQVSGSVVNPGEAAQTIRVELSSTNTASLTAGQHNFVINATLSGGHIILTIEGEVTVNKQVQGA